MNGTWGAYLANQKERVRLKLREVLARVGVYSRPSFLILGAQKAGTVALHKYLCLHPQIIPATGKEIGFFNKDRFFAKGEPWYHRHFPRPGTLGQDSVTFEATPEYLYYPVCAERIFSYDQQLGLIVLLRDPVERAFSAWAMFRDMFYNRRKYLFARSRSANEAVRSQRDQMLACDTFPEFDEAVFREMEQRHSSAPAPEPSYVRRGLYAEQLRRYLRFFQRDQILVLDSRSLRANAAGVLNDVVRFLGLPEHPWHKERLPLHHTGSYGGARMSDRTRHFLAEFYAAVNQELYDLLGRDFGW
jgi:hypothetical protein